MDTITESAAFQRWFGDSKVVDKRGAPLIAYHGSSDAGGLFEGTFRSITRGSTFFATDSYPMALSYADAHRSFDFQAAEPGVVPLYLSIQRPLLVDWGGKRWRGTEAWVEKAREGGHDGLIITNVLDFYGKEDNERRGAKPGTVYVWFNPAQSKSAATGPLRQEGRGAIRGEFIRGSGPNNGNFSADDPSIVRNVGAIEPHLHTDLATAFLRFANMALPGVASDVVYWSSSNADARFQIAIVVDAARFAPLFGLTGGTDEAPAEASASTVRRISNAVSAAFDVSLDAQGSESLADLLSRLNGRVVPRWFRKQGVSVDDEAGDLKVGFIVAPGYPWPAEGDRYWSARDQEWKRSDRPGWLITVQDEQASYPNSVNPCAIFPPDATKTAPGGAVAGDLDGMTIMVTHSLSLPPTTGFNPRNPETPFNRLSVMHGVNECGGFLLPSLSVGPIPATNFGPIVFVAHLELVLASLAPYRSGSRMPCWVYGSDAWTLTTGDLLTATSSELFAEFHGGADWMSRYVAALGVPPASWSNQEDKWHEPLKTTKQLATSIKRQLRGWTKSLTRASFDRQSEDPTRYAYTEAKAREVVRLDDFPFIIAPQSMRMRVERFVADTEYTGQVIFGDMPDVRGDRERAYEHYLWAWKVAEIVKGLRPVVSVRT